MPSPNATHRTQPTMVGWRRPSLLIIEDNANVQQMFREIGESAGFNVTVVGNRRDATAQIERRAFDVAVIDKRLEENDPSNDDGLRVLHLLQTKNEGTQSIFLTAHGEFRDAVRAIGEFGACQIMDKNPSNPDLAQELRVGMQKAFAAKPTADLEGATILCGNEDGTTWETHVKTVLKLSGTVANVQHVANELAATCAPLFERPEDNGIERAGTAMAGLFWSRGLGETIVITLQRERDADASGFTNPSSWPPKLTLGQPIISRKAKNIAVQILACSGVEPRDFTIRRSPIL